MRRFLKTYFTYGIATDDLSRREKIFWVSMLYTLLGLVTWYSVREMITAQEDETETFAGEPHKTRSKLIWDALPAATKREWDHDFNAWYLSYSNDKAKERFKEFMPKTPASS